MTKTLAPWLIILAVTFACCLMGGPTPNLGVDTVPSPPPVLAVAGGLLILLGWVRQRYSA